ncbi:MAG: hypothetical protein WKF96_01770 [Solirubrobacteraceae bacterium]
MSAGKYWSIFDQGISSASSFLLVLSIARGSDVKTVGQFLLAYLLYGFVLGVGRAIGGDVLLLRAAERPAEVDCDCRRLLGLALLLSVPTASIFVIAALAVGGGALSTSLLALALALAPVLFQDALRYCLFAQARPSLAAVNDSIWLAVQLALTAALLLFSPDAGPAAFVLAWASGALVAAALGIWQSGMLPTRRDLRRWFTEDKGRVSSFFTDFAVMVGAANVAVYLIAVIASVEDVAAVRGMLLLFSPLDALFVGIRILTLPALVRAMTLGGASARRLAYLVALTSTLVTAVWALLIIALPDSVGHAVLGATWDVAKPLTLAIAVASIALYAALPLQAGLRALRDARRLVVLRAIQTALLFIGVVAGTALNAAQGAAQGLAIASVAGGLLWWRGFSQSSRAMAPPVAREPAAPERA